VRGRRRGFPEGLFLEGKRNNAKVSRSGEFRSSSPRELRKPTKAALVIATEVR
jgi:hypothetical protein